jgi:hypothetical protein
MLYSFTHTWAGPLHVQCIFLFSIFLEFVVLKFMLNYLSSVET